MGHPAINRRQWLKRLAPVVADAASRVIETRTGVDLGGATASEEAPPPPARLDTSRCIAYRGPECGACVGLCPGAAAIVLVRWRPVLSQEACTGCGACVEACPTSPPALFFESPVEE